MQVESGHFAFNITEIKATPTATPEANMGKSRLTLGESCMMNTRDTMAIAQMPTFTIASVYTDFLESSPLLLLSVISIPLLTCNCQVQLIRQNPTAHHQE